jgi:HD-GYP domain-containing protein (c-di-GMP phosphodiesterase class II)
VLTLPGTRDGDAGGASLLFGADPNSEEEHRIDESRERRQNRLAKSDRWYCLIGAAGFVAIAAAAPFLLESDRSPPTLVAPLLVLAFALAARVEFEVGQGSAVPTQLVLVPMLFVLPLGVVPACVAIALLLSDAPLFVTRRAHPERAAVLLLSSWYVLGPVVVLCLAGAEPPDWGDWPIYVAALLAQFAVDFVASAGRGWFAFRIPPRTQIGAMASVWAVDATLAPVGLFAAFEASEAPYSFLAGVPLILLLGVFARERQARISNALELSSAYRGTALLLGDVVEADDAYTGAHSRDVVTLVRNVAQRLGLDARSVRDAEFVALLHDVGKIRTPKEIINKPGPLTPEERAVIQQHTLEGERMLVAVGGILAHIGHLVRSCHERWDGQGYPDGLAGEDIPLVARIVCACDAFSAITTTRAYRQGRSVEAALAELRRCAGADFDPLVVDALASAIEADLPQAAAVASGRPLGLALPVARQP